MGLMEFANRLAQHSKVSMCRPPPPQEKESIKSFSGRVCLLQTAMSDTGTEQFATKTHMVAKLGEFDDETNKFLVQPYNQSGDKDGGISPEETSDIWVFPPIGTAVAIRPNGPLLLITDYDVGSGQVSLSDGNTGAPTAKAKKGAKEASAKPKTGAKGASAKAKTGPKGASAKTKTKRKAETSANKRKKKKPLDKMTTSTEETVEAGKASKFSLQAVLRSFEDPRCTCLCLLACLYFYFCLFILFRSIVRRVAPGRNVKAPGVASPNAG